MDLIIGLIAIVLVAYYIVKGYSATGVLMFGGLVLLFISVLMGHSILPEGVKSTSSTYFDILEYVKYLLGNRGGGLGLMIMVLCGFSVYMTHLGANDVVVKLVSKPLKNIRHTINLVRVADKITHRFYRIRRIGRASGKIHLRQNRQIAR